MSMEGERNFQLKWKEGTTVMKTINVPPKPVDAGDDVTYPDLAEKIIKEWTNGSHKAPNDNKIDRAILHTDNSTEFGHVIAVLDVITPPSVNMTSAVVKLRRLPRSR